MAITETRDLRFHAFRAWRFTHRVGLHEAVMVAGAFLVYFLVRASVDGRASTAFANGRDVIAFGQHQHIANDDLTGGHAGFHPRSDHTRVRGQQVFQRRHRPLRAMLLPEREHRIDDHHRPDDQPQYEPLTTDQREAACAPQQQRHGMTQLSK